MKLKALLFAAILAPLCALAQWNVTPPDAMIPEWESAVPQIVHPDSSLVTLYNKAWQTAASRVRRGPEGMVASPYLDENCYDDQIWIWDSAFMVMFSKYAPEAFPGRETLMNLYAPIHDGAQSPLRIHLRDNPPIFAWVESEYQKFTGIPARLSYLKKHYHYFNSLQKGHRDERVSPNPIFLNVSRDSLGRAEAFTWNGNGSGMDNTPRGRGCGGWNGIYWIDAISQQALAALCISRLEPDAEEAARWFDEYTRLKTIVNNRYWSEDDGFYFDIDTLGGSPCRVMTLASVWPLLAEIPDSARAARMVEKIRSPHHFGGLRPWNSVSRSDVDFDSVSGNYWRGGIWLPMAYMGTKALEKYGYCNLADSLAENIVNLQSRVFQNYSPHTIWETYSPMADEPSIEHGHIVRQEFCGWSALGPISLMIENVLGFRNADAGSRTLDWTLKPRNGTHGVRNFRFGDVVANIIFSETTGRVNVMANRAFTLNINGVSFCIRPGINTLIPYENSKN